VVLQLNNIELRNPIGIRYRTYRTTASPMDPGPLTRFHIDDRLYTTARPWPMHVVRITTYRRRKKNLYKSQVDDNVEALLSSEQVISLQIPWLPCCKNFNSRFRDPEDRSIEAGALDMWHTYNNVSSNCALLFPSTVVAVQLSGQ